MRAVVQAKFFFNVKWLVVALFVLIPDDLVWARNNATGTARA